jgi:regulator of sigma E protease
METLFYYAVVPLLILGIAINIHEFGHYIIGKIFGMRIEAYSFFGLGPRIWGFKRGHTDYRISAIPLGAYVKFYGDEATAGLEGGSSSGESVPDSELFELRPRWQKFFVMLGGPFMNIVLALAIPFFMGLTNGVPAEPQPIIGFVKQDGAAAKAGLQIGDKVISFNGIENPTWRNIEMDALLIPEQNAQIVVERNGQMITLQITPAAKEISGQKIGDLEMSIESGAMVEMVQPNSPAAEAGFQPKDKILSINNEKVENNQTAKELIQKHKDSPIKIIVERSEQKAELTATPKISEDGTPRIGIIFGHPLVPATIGSAFRHSIATNLSILSLTAKALGQVFTGNRAASETVSGPVGIFKESANAAKVGGWQGAISMLMMISLSLGVMNLLPIPMLDGGQIMLLGVEKVFSWFGKTLTMGLKEKINMVGFATIMLLMVSVMYFDISKFFR